MSIAALNFAHTLSVSHSPRAGDRCCRWWCCWQALCAGERLFRGPRKGCHLRAHPNTKRTETLSLNAHEWQIFLSYGKKVQLKACEHPHEGFCANELRKMKSLSVKKRRFIDGPHPEFLLSVLGWKLFLIKITKFNKTCSETRDKGRINILKATYFIICLKWSLMYKFIWYFLTIHNFMKKIDLCQFFIFSL